MHILNNCRYILSVHYQRRDGDLRGIEVISGNYTTQLATFLNSAWGIVGASSMSRRVVTLSPAIPGARRCPTHV
jgi:hypothetical protein